MPLDPEFVDDAFYGPGGLLIDEVLEVDEERSFVRVRMPTHADLPLTREQKAHPVRHPRHVSGALMVHMTGVLGMVHSYYVLGIRHQEGWVGYGGAIHKARYKDMAHVEAPMELHATATKIRRGDKRILCRYDFQFFQEGRLIYESDQTAMWIRIQEEEASRAAEGAEGAEGAEE